MNVFRVWVVEMLEQTSRGKKWMPCVGAKLTKEDATRDARHWRARNPTDTFRVVKYVRQEP